MITLQDLESAIKECEGQRNPNSSTALKLAAFYTIKNELYPKEEQFNNMINNKGYSYAAPPVDASNTIEFDSGTEFGKAVNGMRVEDVLRKLDEIMSSLYVIEPSLYNQIIQSLIEL